MFTVKGASVAIASLLLHVSCAAPVVQVLNGTLIGSTANGVDTFNGIPFAQAPTGDLRLRRPQSWNSHFGTLNATNVPPKCPQFSGTTDFPPIPLIAIPAVVELLADAGPAQSQSEDCLFLNVQRPASTEECAELPVLVWIHGGGYETGSASTVPSNTGAIIIQRSVQLNTPVIYVAIQYRLNGFGFLGGKDVADARISNLGLRDQRMALEWIHENIRAFGGDSSKVTIYGESAGAWSTFNHLLINSGDNVVNGSPLFRSAIAASGTILPAEAIDSDRAESAFTRVVDTAGCTNATDKLQCLRALPYEKFNAAVNNANGVFSYESLNLQYIARPDPRDGFFPLSPDIAVAQGRYARVPLIAGDLEDEGTIFTLTSSNVSSTELLVKSLGNYFQTAPKRVLQALVDSYPNDLTQGSPFRTGVLNEIYPQYKRLSAIIGDTFFTLARRAVLHRICGTLPCWSYLGTFGHGNTVVGTQHGADLPPVFRNETAAGSESVRMLDYFLAFVAEDDPNRGAAAQRRMVWPAWNARSFSMLEFAASGTKVIQDTFRGQQYATFARSIGQLLH